MNGTVLGSEDRPGQEAGSRGQQQLATASPAGPAPVAVPRSSAAVTPICTDGAGPKGSVAAASCSLLLAKRKLSVVRRPFLPKNKHVTNHVSTLVLFMMPSCAPALPQNPAGSHQPSGVLMPAAWTCIESRHEAVDSEEGL